MAYWLLKSEPETYSLDDLERDGVTRWEGVRNYQARNSLKSMKKGDQAFFYHSSCDPPGIVGICRVCSAPYPDPTAFDENSKYFDPKSDPEQPRWWLVDVEFVQRLPRILPLSELQAQKGLQKMPVTRKGNRLSVTPVSAAEWKRVLKLAEA